MTIFQDLYTALGPELVSPEDRGFRLLVMKEEMSTREMVEGKWRTLEEARATMDHVLGCMSKVGTREDSMLIFGQSRRVLSVSPGRLTFRIDRLLV